MICLRGRGRNRPTLLSSKTGQRHWEFTMRDWQDWLDAWELWMTGCCAVQTAGDIGSL